MARLNAAARKKIPKSQFGLPGAKGAKAGKGKYPMPDKSHASNAKARATQMVKKGKLSPAQARAIDSKADRVLGEKEPKSKGKSSKGKPK